MWLKSLRGYGRISSSLSFCCQAKNEGGGRGPGGKDPGSVGKRLDFLFQEMNREANTLGSKAASMDMTRSAMDLKLLIEQMREQAQNIE